MTLDDFCNFSRRQSLHKRCVKLAGVMELEAPNSCEDSHKCSFLSRSPSTWEGERECPWTLSVFQEDADLLSTQQGDPLSFSTALPVERIRSWGFCQTSEEWLALSAGGGEEAMALGQN